MFANSLAIVDECRLTHLHVFPFSPRKGTPAARMPQLARAIVKERAARLREKGEAALLAHLDGEVGRTREVLVEREGLGRTEQFTQIEFTDTALQAGDLVKLTVTGHTGRHLLATPARQQAA
jgi:threonylcarbamoyladenosine tRNA methylthiotransferase MtaB